MGPALWGLSIAGPGHTPLSLRPQLNLPAPLFRFPHLYAPTPGSPCPSLPALASALCPTQPSLQSLLP